MADSQGRFRGNDELLYVTTGTAPATLTDPSLYDQVGLLQSNDFESSKEEIRASDKAVSGYRGVLLGNGEYNVPFSATRKNDGDTGQTTLRDAHLNDTKVYWLITTNVSGDQCKHGEGYVPEYSEPSPTNEYSTCSGRIAGDGAPTFEAVP